MVDEHENIIDLVNYPSIESELESWEGAGTLSWRDISEDGEFRLVRLLNGRLRFVFKFLDPGRSEQFTELHNLEFAGAAKDGSRISVKGIHFTASTISPFLHTYSIEMGYASSATRHINEDVNTDTISIRCDLTNYSLNQGHENVQFKLSEFDIQIRRLSAGKKSNGIREHEIAYKHASISTCLEINNIPLNKTENAFECLREITELLSIACRGHVFIAVQHIWNQETKKQDSFFEEPPFSDEAWGRPLIPSNSIEDFLLAAYPVDKNRVRKLELSHATDHYLQALTLRSIWPQSVGIFTAMESLKVAFFNQNNNEENQMFNYWVTPPEKFGENKDMIQEIVNVLTKSFPRFESLTQSEKQSLKSQIAGLNRRSYKTQLKHMLTLLNIDSHSRDLQFFVNTRNRLIHEGTPVAANTPLDKYDEKMETALRDIDNSVSLFESALLSFLNYDGPRELFNEALKL